MCELRSDVKRRNVPYVPLNIIVYQVATGADDDI